MGQNDLYMYYVLFEFELAPNIVLTLLFYLNTNTIQELMNELTKYAMYMVQPLDKYML